MVISFTGFIPVCTYKRLGTYHLWLRSLDFGYVQGESATGIWEIGRGVIRVLRRVLKRKFIFFRIFTMKTLCGIFS